MRGDCGAATDPYRGVFRADALSDGISGDRTKLPGVTTLRSQMYCASPKAA
jgi:hypothetical protein